MIVKERVIAPSGLKVNVFSPNYFFRQGVVEWVKQMPAAHSRKGAQEISVLHFADNFYQLEWSRRPKLPAGKVVIVVNTRQLSELSGIFYGDRVSIISDNSSMLALSEAINQLQDSDDEPQAANEDILLTFGELAFMWGYLQRGHVGGNAKQNSRYKRNVMKKLGVQTEVGLLTKFQLLYLLDMTSRQKKIRIRSNKRSTGVRESLALSLLPETLKKRRPRQRIMQ